MKSMTPFNKSIFFLGRPKLSRLIIAFCVLIVLLAAACAEKEEDEDDELADVNGPQPAKELVVQALAAQVFISWEIPTKEDSLFNRDIRGFMITRTETEADAADPSRTQRYVVGDVINLQTVVAIIEAEPTKDDQIVITWTDEDVQKGATYHYKIYSYDEVPNYSEPFFLEATPGSLIEPRTNHAQVVLDDGRIFLCGGLGYGRELDSAEIFDPDAGTFEMLDDTLNRPRTDHTATLLKDGRVLIVGGFDEVTNEDEEDDEDEDADVDEYVETLSSAEIFDPDTGTFTLIDGKMSVGRGHHTAMLLPDGTVLIAGGNDGVNAYNSAEIFDPTDLSFTVVVDLMAKGRFGHSMTSFYQDTRFRIFIAGGSTNQESLDSATFFNFESQDFGRYDPSVDDEENALDFSRTNHAAALTPDGVIALIGGFTGPLTAGGRIGDIELLDTTTGDFSEMTPLDAPRSDSCCALLDDGSILVAGGIGNGYEVLTSTELVDPSADSVTEGPSMNFARFKAQTSVLDDGRILATGGNGSADPFAPHPLSTAEIYSPSSNSWTVVPSP